MNTTDAFGLEPGDKVRHTIKGASGEVVESRLPGELTVRWTKNAWYDATLHDYIGTTTWDLLDVGAGYAEPPGEPLCLERL